jgi:hypothetical protein
LIILALWQIEVYTEVTLVPSLSHLEAEIASVKIEKYKSSSSAQIKAGGLQRRAVLVKTDV